jgi:hypothetical protein
MQVLFPFRMHASALSRILHIPVHAGPAPFASSLPCMLRWALVVYRMHKILPLFPRRHSQCGGSQENAARTFV